MIAGVYARKSTEQHGVAEDAKSVTLQVENARADVARKGWIVADAHVYVDDAISGAEFVNRPGLSQLLAALSPRPPFDALILADPSRLGREQIETAYTLKRITDAGVAVWYYLDDRRAAMDSALAKVMASLSGFASESERELARARTYDALARRAKAGHVAGGLTYGYVNVRTDGGYVERRVSEAEAAVVRSIFARYAAGMGPRALVAALVAEGASPPKPRRRGLVPGWSPAAIRDILARSTYRGEVVWNKLRKTDRGGRTRVRVPRPESEWVRVEVPALRIIDDATWHAVQARRRMMADRRPAGAWTRSAATATPALLAGIGRCARCGSALTRRGRPHGAGGTRRTRVLMYGCSARARPGVCANRVELHEETIDRAVLEALAGALSAETIEQAVEQAMAEARATFAGSAARRAAIERDLATLAKRTARLTEAVAGGTGAARPLLEKLAEEETRRVALVRERDALDATAGALDFATAKVRRALQQRAADVRAALLAHRDEARDVLAAFVSRIEFEPFGAGRARGYRFAGTGDYGLLLGTALGSGVPDGTHRRRSSDSILPAGPSLREGQDTRFRHMGGQAAPRNVREG